MDKENEKRLVIGIIIVAAIGVIGALLLMAPKEPTPTAPTPYCGDGSCQSNEHCSWCPTDCGYCYCGDGECNPSEDCSDCPADCGECPVECGDGKCDSTEDCSSCSEDCGDCPPECGDGDCNGDETCETCSQDCGRCMNEISLKGMGSKAICESYDGWVVSENGNSQITEYDPESGRILFEYEIGSPKWSVECLRNNNLLIIGFDRDSREYEVQEINHKGEVVKRVGESDLDDCGPQHALEYGRNWLISCYKDGTEYIKVVNPNTKDTAHSRTASDIRDIFIKDGKYGYASADTIYLLPGETYDFQTQAFIKGEAIIGISVMDNGNYLIAGGRKASEVDAESGEILRTYRSPGISTYDAEELSNGNWVVLSVDSATEVDPTRLSKESFAGVSGISIVSDED